MQKFSTSPHEMLNSLWRNRNLISVSIKRDIAGRYRGSFMGILWSFLTPLFMLTVYTFVFSFIFKARWGTSSDSKTEFALILFSGLMVFSLFSECVNRAPSLITGNPNYVKKVIFPLEILPWINIGSALFHFSISLVVWMIVFSYLFGAPKVTTLYLPIVLLPLVFFTMGICWALASLGVYIRDTSQLIGIITSTLMFLSPIFYPVTAIPENYRFLLYINPLTTVIESIRDVLFWGHAPDFKIIGAYTLASVAIAWLGFFWFQKTRKGFADVL